MAKNYMADIAKMLGVELEEEFMIFRVSGTYKFTTEGVEVKSNKQWVVINLFLIDLITGKHRIVKIPWKPKTNEAYYRPSRKFFGVTSKVWTGNPYDYAFMEAGMIYRTEKECEAALPGLRKKYLGGNDNEQSIDCLD